MSESQPYRPTAALGALRARMEARLRASGTRHCIVRLPEFYGPYVVSLTARVFRAALRRQRVLWPGPLDREIELVYMPDAATAVVRAGSAPGADGDTFHIPGGRTTPRRFIGAVCAAANVPARMLGAPRLMLALAGVFSPTLRGVADIAHLWTDPILLDGRKYEARFGAVPRTSYDRAIQEAIAWHRDNPGVTLQG